MSRVVGDGMRAYYDRRADEYDDWWLGTGQFARRGRPAWSEEVERLVEVVHALPPANVLDVACGTGFLTRELQGRVTALDQSPAMLRVASARLPGARMVLGEAVPLPFEDGAFDRIFTGHFYGHLLPGEREAFLVEARRVAPQLVVVDSARRPEVPAEEWQARRLDDGSIHQVYKRYYEPDELIGELGDGRVLHAGPWFVAVTVDWA